jgi:hypothetical protein
VLTVVRFKSSEVHSKIITGKFSSYDTDGFVTPLYSNMTENMALWETLQTGWIDDNTRAVVVQFFLFNAYYNLFTSVQLLVEFPVMGTISTKSEISTARLFPYVNKMDYFILSLELLLIIYLATYIIDEILEVKIRLDFALIL